MQVVYFELQLYHHGAKTLVSLCLSEAQMDNSVSLTSENEKIIEFC